MPKIAIKSATLAELKRQVNDELNNVHAYKAMAIWCEKENLKGFASYFKKQSAEEHEHADKLINHLLDRGEYPELSTIVAPKTDYKNLMDIAKMAQSMEGATTGKINAAYETAVKEGDFPAQLLLQWFINEQVEEEAWTDEMVDRVANATCAGALAALDNHIVRYLTKETGA